MKLSIIAIMATCLLAACGGRIEDTSTDVASVTAPAHSYLFVAGHDAALSANAFGVGTALTIQGKSASTSAITLSGPVTSPNGYVGYQIHFESASTLCVDVPASAGTVTEQNCSPATNTNVLSVGGLISNYAGACVLATGLTGGVSIVSAFNPGIAPGCTQWTATGLNMSIQSTDTSGGRQPYFATQVSAPPRGMIQAAEDTGVCGTSSCAPSGPTQIFYPFLDATGLWMSIEASFSNSWASPNQKNAVATGNVTFQTGAGCQQWGLPVDTISGSIGEMTSPCSGAWTWPNAAGARLTLGGSDTASIVTYYPKQ